ncbi:hypothetical protein [Paraburkholderia sp.]|uniref:hypothetical protein n=1 Tax=Paraburkholderia sp. TaxID=1926495 RepID=UPI002600B03E|nr:hypothetical protein [Paraburkholderia sp.]
MIQSTLFFRTLRFSKEAALDVWRSHPDNASTRRRPPARTQVFAQASLPYSPTNQADANQFGFLIIKKQLTRITSDKSIYYANVPMDLRIAEAKFDLEVIPVQIIQKLEKTTTHERFSNACHMQSASYNMQRLRVRLVIRECLADSRCSALQLRTRKIEKSRRGFRLPA